MFKKIAFVAIAVVSIAQSSGAWELGFNNTLYNWSNGGQAITGMHTEMLSATTADPSFKAFFIADNVCFFIHNLDKADTKEIANQLTTAYLTGQHLRWARNLDQASPTTIGWMNLGGTNNGASITVYHVYSGNRVIFRTVL